MRTSRPMMIDSDEHRLEAAAGAVLDPTGPTRWPSESGKRESTREHEREDCYKRGGEQLPVDSAGRPSLSAGSSWAACCCATRGQDVSRCVTVWLLHNIFYLDFQEWSRCDGQTSRWAAALARRVTVWLVSALRVRRPALLVPESANGWALRGATGIAKQSAQPQEVGRSTRRNVGQTAWLFVGQK